MIIKIYLIKKEQSNRQYDTQIIGSLDGKGLALKLGYDITKYSAMHVLVGNENGRENFSFNEKFD